MENLISHLNKNFFLSLHSSKKLAEIIAINEIKKGTIFIKKGKVNKKEYLLFEGICRSYIVNDKGDDITLSFFTSNSAIPPNLTRIKSNKSILNVQALSNVSLATFSSEDLMSLMSTYREIEVWGNTILQTELLQKVAKEINQISLNAKDKLIDFRSQYPLLENQIPHSYISSYLGITNVSLSRIRKELSSK